MEKLNVKVINKSRHDLPAYQSEGAAGLDLKANINSHIFLEPGDRVLIPTGLFPEIPEGYEAQVRPRSGLANNHGITVLNTPGTLDSDYRGEIKVLLINLSKQAYMIRDGERIAQAVFSPVSQIQWEESAELSVTSRGEGGFGSTGRDESVKNYKEEEVADALTDLNNDGRIDEKDQAIKEEEKPAPKKSSKKKKK